MPVMIGVAGEAKVEAIFHPYQSLHRIDRGRVHANLSVPVHRHKSEGGVDGLVDNREIQTIG